MTQKINVKEAVTKIKNGEAVLVDVREADEYKAEHIAYALSVPLSSLEDGFQMLDIPKDKVILFQCLKGTRGQMACDRISNLGSCSNTIMNVEGGIEAWKQAGLPIISLSESTPRVSIMRQVQIVVGLLVLICVLIGLGGLTGAYIFAGLLGAALFFAGLTGWCGLAKLLAKMPWNQ